MGSVTVAAHFLCRPTVFHIKSIGCTTLSTAETVNFKTANEILTEGRETRQLVTEV
jgi:hypothetical protein